MSPFSYIHLYVPAFRGLVGACVTRKCLYICVFWRYLFRELRLGSVCVCVCVCVYFFFGAESGFLMKRKEKVEAGHINLAEEIRPAGTQAPVIFEWAPGSEDG